MLLGEVPRHGGAEDAEQMHQRPLEQHVVLEEIQLEHELRLGGEVGVDGPGGGLVVALDQELELPLQAADEARVPVEFVPGVEHGRVASGRCVAG